MTELSTTQTTNGVIPSDLERFIVQPLPCPTWCTTGPHTKQHPDDMDCRSERHLIPVSLGPVTKYGAGVWTMAYLDVSLSRRHRDGITRVVIGSDDDHWIELTCDEADDLANVIQKLTVTE